MENTKIAGGSFLSNLQSKRYELEGTIVTKIEGKSKGVELEICEKDIENEIDIKDYLNKPIEFLIKDAKEAELIDEDFEGELNFYLEAKNELAIDIDFVDIFEDKEIPFNNEMNTYIEKKNNTLTLESLQDRLDFIQKELEEKDQQIDSLKEENKGLQKTILREQDIVMKEQDLHDKTLSRVEQLLLEKRSELIERQKASKKNWLLKLLDKVKA